MKKYKLKVKYPSLFQKNEIGDIVYYNSLTKNYVKAGAPHYSVSVYDVENFPDCWELVEEEPTWTKNHCLSFDDVMMAIGYKAGDPDLAIKLEKELEKLAKERSKE